MLLARIALTALMVASLFGIGMTKVAGDEMLMPAIALEQANQDLVLAAR